MKCKRCKREIQKDFNICPYCGLRLIPDATEIRVPEPKRKANGDYAQQVMYNGKRYMVIAPTLEEYKAKARAIKLGDLPEEEELYNFVPLEDIISDYIESKRDKIAARSIALYETFLRGALADVGECSPESVDWQKLIDGLAKKYAGGTVNVQWGLITRSLKRAGYPVPSVDLPKAGKKSTILDDDQIPILLEHIRGNEAECGILLCLHSLRRSEAYAITKEDVHDGFIHVNKAYVADTNWQYHIEHKTKTEKSTRKIPVFIDRLYEVLPDVGTAVPFSIDHFRKTIRRLCAECGLPECTAHDLRRSFASLAYSRGIPERRIMEYGGWSTPQIMYDVYVRLYEKDSGKDAEPLKTYFNFTTNDPKPQ